MKVVQFTIPVSQEHSIMVQEDKLPHFYNHLHRHNETQITWIIKGKARFLPAPVCNVFNRVIFISLAPTSPTCSKAILIILKRTARKTFMHLPYSLTCAAPLAISWNYRK